MALKAFKRVQFPQPDLLQFQSNVAEIFQQLSNCPFLTGTHVKTQKITTTATNVSHGLGTVPQGYLVLTSNANPNIWQISATTSIITLQASAPVTVDLWIF